MAKKPSYLDMIKAQSAPVAPAVPAPAPTVKALLAAMLPPIPARGTGEQALAEARAAEAERFKKEQAEKALSPPIRMVETIRLVTDATPAAIATQPSPAPAKPVMTDADIARIAAEAFLLMDTCLRLLRAKPYDTEAQRTAVRDIGVSAKIMSSILD